MKQSVDTDWKCLLDAARQGDDDALGQVCEQVRSYLLLVADRGLSGGLRTKLGASDIVQQTMLEARQDFGQFAGTSEEELRAWLVKIVQHNLIDSARRYREAQRRDLSRELPIDQGLRPLDLVGPDKTASSIVRRRETDEELLRAIARLPEKRRRIIELRHRQGLSYAEIAEQLNISEVAARKLWSRTVEALRQELATTNETRSIKPTSRGMLQCGRGCSAAEGRGPAGRSTSVRSLQCGRGCSAAEGPASQVLNCQGAGTAPASGGARSRPNHVILHRRRSVKHCNALSYVGRAVAGICTAPRRSRPL